jgi:hypothetical protein
MIAAVAAASTGRVGNLRELYKPATGFWLAPSNHSGALYGPSDSHANWNVAQWDIPADLPAFKRDISENSYARVAILGVGRYELAQFAAQLECERRFASKRLLVNEFDLFVSPNGRTTPGFPDAASGEFPNLAVIRRLRHRIKIEPIELRAGAPGCAVTQGAFISAVVLANDRMKQTLFYQLRLAVLRYKDRRMQNLEASPHWFFGGENTQSGSRGQYGFSDHLSSFGERNCVIGVESAYDIDLLPRLRDVIRAGASKGLDQKFANWVPRGTYHGSLAFGHVEIRSRWSGFSLAVDSI